MTLDGVDVFPVHVAYVGQALPRECHCLVLGWGSWWARTREEATAKALASVAQHLGVDPGQVLFLTADPQPATVHPSGRVLA